MVATHHAGLSINARLLHTAPSAATASVVVTEPGVVAGLAEALEQLPEGLAPLVDWQVRDGDPVTSGQVIGTARGSAIELNRIEDHLLGVVGVASGIATRARAIASSNPDLRIVCGAWKKLPSAMKPALRAGLDAAGVGHRLLAEEFVYIDKNAVVLLGGVGAAVRAGHEVGNGAVAVQLKQADECDAAVSAGAAVLMIDTGRVEDLRKVRDRLRTLGRDDVQLAFGGGVRTEDLGAVANAGATIVDIGRQILDAPLLDLRFDVLPPRREER